MVCLPCFIIPVLLFLWHKFIQPYVLRFWNPWAVKDADGNVKTEFPFKCEGGVCAFSGKKIKKKEPEGNITDDEKKAVDDVKNELNTTTTQRVKVD